MDSDTDRAVNLAAFSAAENGERLVLVVGLGLIGSAVAEQLRMRTDGFVSTTLDWQRPKQSVSAIAELVEKSGQAQVELVWAAGKAGFAGSAQELATETTQFCELIDGLHQHLGERLSVSFISTAGGMYEYSGYVEDLSHISPKRPYALAKLEQENHLDKLGIAHRIYRVSSVYGSKGSRVGLISALLRSAYSGQLMEIYASQNTVRDYIFAPDLGRLVAEDVLSYAGFGTCVAASGRAVSVSTLVNYVRRITRRPLRVSYRSDSDNDQNISFARQVIRTASSVTSLEEGIALVYRRQLPVWVN